MADLHSLAKHVSEVAHRLRNSIESCSQRAQESRSGVQESIEGLQQSLQEWSALIDTLCEECENWRTQTTSQAEAILEALHRESDALSESMEANREVFNTLMQSLSGCLEQATIQQNEFAMESRESKERLEEWATAVGEIESRLNDEATAIESSLTESKTALEEYRSSLESLGQDAQQALSEGLLADFEESCSDLSEAIENLETESATALESAASEMESKSTLQVESLQSQIDEWTNGLISDTEEIVRSLSAVCDAMDTTAETIVTTKEVMGTSMQSSSIGITTVLGIFQELREAIDRVG